MAYNPVPDSNLSNSTNLPHLVLEYHRKTALDRLMTTFLFNEPAQKDMLPKRQGRSIKFFRYSNYAAATTAKTEGAVGTSINTPGSATLTIQVSQYSDYMTVSDLMEATALDPIVDNHADLIGYRGGLSVDTITRTVVDDQASSTNQSLIGTYLTLKDLRAHAAILNGRNVLPFSDGLFYTIAHPYVTFDVINDPAANGLADTFKHTNPEKAALIKANERGTSPVFVAGGCKVVHSTNVAQPSASTWRAYTFGKGAYGCADLEGFSPDRNVDPAKAGFNVRVIRPSANNIADPEGVIGGAVAYKFVFGVKVLDGPVGIGGTYRYITATCPSSIVS